MLRILPETGGDLLAIRANGTLTHEDYEKTLIPRLEAIVSAYGKARLLCDMGSGFAGWEPEAMWDDARFGFQHRNDITRLAVVGGPDWLRWASRLMRHLTDAEVETFPQDEQQQALDWVRA